jgi:hypothetical protein
MTTFYRTPANGCATCKGMDGPLYALADASAGKLLQLVPEP